MFCPNCRDEFRPEIAVCPDCEVHLVEELTKIEIGGLLADPAVAMEVRHVAFLPVAESVLQAAKIPYFVQGREALDLLTFLRARILVPKDRCEEAKTLLSTAAQECEEPEPDELPIPGS